MIVIKRNGAEVPFEQNKISNAVFKAFKETNEAKNLDIAKIQADIISDMVVVEIQEQEIAKPTVELIQDMVEENLMKLGFTKTAKAYIIYREQHAKERSRKEEILDVISGKFMEVTEKGRDSVVTKGSSGNANVDTEGPMGKMLSYGAETSKVLALEDIVSKEFAEAHKNGDIHIHDLDFYATRTLTCCQIDLEKLFKNGFSTGHGFLREPQSIGSYAALAAIALQANQNDQHGGQSIPAFDFYMAPGVLKTFHKEFKKFLEYGYEDLIGEYAVSKEDKKIVDEAALATESIIFNIFDFADELYRDVAAVIDEIVWDDMVAKAYERAYNATNKSTYQAMEGFIHNMNTMHSRAGAQVPFTSINYGTDISPEGRMVIENLLLTTEAGLGDGETPIFPIQIFKLKEGISYNDDDPNADLFNLACRVSAKRLFPNFSFLDAPFNLQYYKEGHPETEATYMGCRTRVIGNKCGEETVTGRGNLSFTTINLPRLALTARNSFPNDEDKDARINEFFHLLDEKLELVKNQLLERMAFQAKAKVANFSFLMGQGVWRGSENLSSEDYLAEIIKQGTLSTGFIGLAETLVALIGKHHGESPEAQELGLKIVKHMRDYCDAESEKYKLNFTLLATPAEGLSGRFIRMDKKKFGEIKGVTDKEWNTNSFHVPVEYNISAFDKVRIEAPYHALTNAGHISYVELDGDTTKNVEAFKSIIKFEKECGMGYASINHPVDRDPECGYVGIIDNECPHCGRKETPDAPFERIRRITGYLVGGMDRWNSAKAAEEAHRVKHTLNK